MGGRMGGRGRAGVLKFVIAFFAAENARCA